LTLIYENLKIIFSSCSENLSSHHSFETTSLQCSALEIL
jgi:hypothetical protein